MDTQIYRWVKASETVPIEYNKKIAFKWFDEAGNDHITYGCYKPGEYFENGNGRFDKQVVEWLEAYTPSLPKESASEILKMFTTALDSFPQARLAVLQAITYAQFQSISEEEDFESQNRILESQLIIANQRISELESEEEKNTSVTHCSIHGNVFEELCAECSSVSPTSVTEGKELFELISALSLPNHQQEVVVQYKTYEYERITYADQKKDWFIRNVQCWLKPLNK